MTRFLAIFTVTLLLGTLTMSAILARYGYSLVDPEMRIMLGLCLCVAGYVAWRISGVLKARSQELSRTPAPGGAGQGRLGALFAPRSKALSARQADLEARRRRLIAEGKLEAEEAPAPEPAVQAAPPPPSSSTRVKDHMALRRERVRKAREEGRLD